MAPTLSIIIPAYNEANRLGRSLEMIYEYLNQAYPNSEVVVVDDGSTDETARIAEESFKRAGDVAVRLIRVKPNQGKGYAVRAGLLAATAPVALFSDADLSTPISETPKLLAAIEQEGRPVIQAAVIDRFSFDVAIYVAHLAGLRLKEIPVRWDHNDGSKVSVLRDSWRMFNEVQRIRARRRLYLETIDSKGLAKPEEQSLARGKAEPRAKEIAASSH